MFRKPVVGGNWKSTGNLASVKSLIEAFKPAATTAADVVIFAPGVHVHGAQKAASGSNVNIGIQNISKTGEGAFTGEVTVGMAKDAGIQWVLIGHSERRSLYGETDEDTAIKTELVLKAGLNAMLCIGELLDERKKGTTNDVCERQLKAVIPRVSDWSRVVIAYEPVWAIGTGVVATPMQAQDTHFAVRDIIKQQCGADIASKVRILYGGSVSPKNCQGLGELSDIDGFLVGGASTKPDFTTIITTAQDLYK